MFLGRLAKLDMIYLEFWVGDTTNPLHAVVKSSLSFSSVPRCLWMYKQTRLWTWFLALSVFTPAAEFLYQMYPNFRVTLHIVISIKLHLHTVSLHCCCVEAEKPAHTPAASPPPQPFAFMDGILITPLTPGLLSLHLSLRMCVCVNVCECRRLYRPRAQCSLADTHFTCCRMCLHGDAPDFIENLVKHGASPCLASKKHGSSFAYVFCC